MTASPLILLAEDELALAHIIRESLEERKFSVVLCADGESVLKQYRNRKPDIVILDIMMPIKDGFEVAKEIREHDKKNTYNFLNCPFAGKRCCSRF